MACINRCERQFFNSQEFADIVEDIVTANPPEQPAIYIQASSETFSSADSPEKAIDFFENGTIIYDAIPGVIKAAGVNHAITIDYTNYPGIYEIDLYLSFEITVDTLNFSIYPIGLFNASAQFPLETYPIGFYNVTIPYMYVPSAVFSSFAFALSPLFGSGILALNGNGSYIRIKRL